VKQRSVFRLLLDLFQCRFLENDQASPTGDYSKNLAQILGAIATPGLLVSVYALPTLLSLAILPPGATVDWTMRVQRLFFPAYSFTVTGFATLFEWDLLFPDRRDFLVLTSFPIRLRELFAAKIAALGIFLLVLMGTVNFWPDFLMPVFASAVPAVRNAGLLRITAAQLAATAGASAFAFFAVAAFQGLLINITSPRTFQKLSPAIQMLGMCLMVLMMLTYPIYSVLIRTAAQTDSIWLRLFPPVWFVGIYELIMPGGDPYFLGLGKLAIEALGASAAVFILSWGVGFRRHYRRMLESEDTSSRAPERAWTARWITSPEERAIFTFSSKTLARNSKHRLFLATYLSVGLSFALLISILVNQGHVRISPEGLRSVPFLITFFVISGFRGALQFPADLGANWVFRLTERSWAETSRSATRKHVMFAGLIPALLLLAPIELLYWGVAPGLLHLAFQWTAGALLIEVLFWRFEKVPFTCSYYPGRTNLAVLAVIYLYGFTTYSFQMADAEKAMDSSLARGVLYFGVGLAALALLWKRHRPATAVLFDATDPEMIVLDLT
jgi:hypothetical protein